MSRLKSNLTIQHVILGFWRKATAQQHTELTHPREEEQAAAQPRDWECILQHSVCSPLAWAKIPHYHNYLNRYWKLQESCLNSKEKEKKEAFFQTVVRKSGFRDSTHSIKKNWTPFKKYIYSMLQVIYSFLLHTEFPLKGEWDWVKSFRQNFRNYFQFQVPSILRTSGDTPTADP